MMLPVKKFLITVLRFHGDVLLITPMLQAIKRQFPDAKVDLLVYKDTASIVEFEPRINKIIEIQPSQKINFLFQIKNEIFLWKRLRGYEYDFALFFTTQWRLALIGRVLKKTLTAAVRDKKRENLFWRKSFSRLFPEAGSNHIIERNLMALKTLGLEVLDEDKEIYISIPNKTIVSSSRLLETHGVHKKYCVIHPCSRRSYKLWTKEGFVSLIAYLQLKNVQVILTSGSDEKEIKYLHDIEEMSLGKVVNLGGKTNMLESAEIIKGASIFVGLDSVASHIAAAVNTPSVVLFGPSNHVNWKPWSDKSEIISRSSHEDYCNIHGDKEGKLGLCLCYIMPDRVIKLVDKILEGVG